MLCSTGLRSYDADPAQPLVNSVNRSMRGGGRGWGDASAGRRREEKKRAEEVEQVKLTRFQCIHNIVNNARWAVSHGCCLHSFLSYSVVLQLSPSAFRVSQPVRQYMCRSAGKN